MAEQNHSGRTGPLVSKFTSYTNIYDNIDYRSPNVLYSRLPPIMSFKRGSIVTYSSMADRPKLN